MNTIYAKKNRIILRMKLHVYINVHVYSKGFLCGPSDPREHLVAGDVEHADRTLRF